MANFTYNQALGRVAELANRVNDNDPTNSIFVMIAFVTTATDATLKDLDTISAIESDVNTAEATNTNYSRKTIDNTGSMTVTVDDTNDRVEIDIPDQTFSSISAGDNWTDIVFGYDSDSTGGTDANIIPLSQHDFAVTPDGSDITVQVGADGFWQAS